MKYLVHSYSGGLMEDFVLREDYHLTIEANTPDEAIKEWAEKTRLNNPKYLKRGLNGKGWSFWGYSIKCFELH